MKKGDLIKVEQEFYDMNAAAKEAREKAEDLFYDSNCCGIYSINLKHVSSHMAHVRDDGSLWTHIFEVENLV